MDLTAISKLDFAKQVTIEIYHCYAAKKFACNNQGELIQENNSPRPPKENEKCSSVVEELVYLLKKENVSAIVYGNTLGVNNGKWYSRGWPRPLENPETNDGPVMIDTKNK